MKIGWFNILIKYCRTIDTIITMCKQDCRLYCLRTAVEGLKTKQVI